MISFLISAALRHMYHVNTEFAYGEREDELSVLEATFFYRLNLLLLIQLGTIVYFMSSFFFSDFLFYFLSGKIKTCL